jgi:hypothetical protein
MPCEQVCGLRGYRGRLPKKQKGPLYNGPSACVASPCCEKEFHLRIASPTDEAAPPDTLETSVYRLSTVPTSPHAIICPGPRPATSVRDSFAPGAGLATRGLRLVTDQDSESSPDRHYRAAPRPPRPQPSPCRQLGRRGHRQAREGELLRRA